MFRTNYACHLEMATINYKNNMVLFRYNILTFYNVNFERANNQIFMSRYCINIVVIVAHYFIDLRFMSIE